MIRAFAVARLRPGHSGLSCQGEVDARPNAPKAAFFDLGSIGRSRFSAAEEKKLGRSLPSDGRHSRRGGLGARCGHQKRPATLGQQEPTMTAFITRTVRQAALVVAFAASISALSSTSGFAYTAEAQQMCTGDAFRLCSSEIPNIAAITACMRKNKANVSAGCRAVMDKEAAAQAGKVATK